MYLFNRLLEFVLLPPLAPWLLLLLALLVLRWHARLGLGLAWASLVLGVLLMSPWSLGMLITPLEQGAVYRPGPPQQGQLVSSPDTLRLSDPSLREHLREGPQAIVVLGGGRNSHAIEYGGESINRLTLERLRYGVHLARQTGLPLLVSGGLGSHGRLPEARLMQRALIEDFAWPARWVEDRSANTRQNAQFTARLLEQAGIHHVLLVTHAVHLPRAQRYFEAAGLRVTGAPTGFFFRPASAGIDWSWLPSANWAYAGWYALHEWAGLLQQRWFMREAS